MNSLAFSMEKDGLVLCKIPGVHQAFEIEAETNICFLGPDHLISTVSMVYSADV